MAGSWARKASCLAGPGIPVLWDLVPSEAAEAYQHVVAVQPLVGTWIGEASSLVPWPKAEGQGMAGRRMGDQAADDLAPPRKAVSLAALKGVGRGCVGPRDP